MRVPSDACRMRHFTRVELERMQRRMGNSIHRKGSTQGAAVIGSRHPW